MSDDLIKRPVRGGDLKLLARLWPLARPLRLIIFFGGFLVLVSSFASVLLPYATKVAIDNYIVPVGPRAIVPPGKAMPEPLRRAFASGEIVPSGFEGIFFLRPAAIDSIDRQEEEKLIAQGLLSRERYYVQRLDGSEGQRAVLALTEGPDPVVKLYPELMAVEAKKLAAISPELTAIWRAADLNGLANLAIIFAFLMLLGYAAEFGQRVVLELATQRFTLDLRQKLLSHLFGLSQSFFDRSQTARLISRVTNDVNNLSNLIKTTVATLMGDLVSLVVIVGLMFSLSPRLALLTIAFTPLTVFLSSYFGRLSRQVQRDLRSRLAIINQSFAETVGGIAIVKAFRREERNISEFARLNFDNYLAGLKQIRIHAIFMPLIDVLASIILALVIWRGGAEVLSGTLTVGVVAAFVGYARRFFMPIQDMAEKLNLFQSAFASLERLTDILDEDERIEEPSEPLTPIKPGGEVEFRGVNFRYLSDGPLVLKDINFTIARGESVALVGRTGSGKSSIINLIERGYDPSSGDILIDGLPLRQLDLKAHRARLGLVTQDVYLYSASVMENLRLGRRHLSEADIKAAVRAVGADRFIERLPKAYDEPLGAGGRHLSAGERQLLACARALIEAPEIIILDEATAQVDAETELLIENALHTLFSGRTSIVIAHRLSTIRRVDRILVIDEGRLIEQGSHEELMSLKGAYYRLRLLQSGRWQSSEFKDEN